MPRLPHGKRATANILSCLRRKSLRNFLLRSNDDDDDDDDDDDRNGSSNILTQNLPFLKKGP